MFTNKLAISRVKERIAVMRDHCIDSCYIGIHYKHRHDCDESQNRHMFFEDKLCHFVDKRFDYEVEPIDRFIEHYGVTGKNTLLAFAGETVSEPGKVWEAIVGTVSIEAIEYQITNKAEDDTDGKKQEHFLFVGFDNREDLLKFTSTFGRKTTEEVLALWEEPMAWDGLSEADVLGGIAHLIDA